MATTINSGIAELSANLEITSLQSATTSTRQQNVRAAVEKGMKVLDSFLAGSYARSTMIGPLAEADIDIFVVLDASHFPNYTPATLLDRVRAVLLQTYTSTPRISRNGQAVTITFDDFRVDVVPAFNREGGGFLIPNAPAGRWIETNPLVHASLLTAHNKAHNGALVPLVKMIKGWNRVINSAFVGFYLELMTMDILNRVTITNFPSGVRYVFGHGREKIKIMQADPAGFGGQVGGLKTVTNVSDGVSRFETAYARAVKAEQYAQRGDVPGAFEEWRKLFGDYFPAYG